MAEGQDNDDRTEEPTERRLEEAIKRGDVPKSVEVNTWFVLGGFTLAVLVLAAPVAQGLSASLKVFLMNAHAVPSSADGFLAAGRRALAAGLWALVLPCGLLLLAALGGALVQNKPLWTLTPLMPQLSRISPGAGFKRIFGREALVQFGKGLLKIAIIGALAWTVLWGERDRLDVLARLDPVAILPASQDLVLKLMTAVLAALAFLAAGDFLYQRFSWRKRLRMTKQELKQEFKETEGNPEIKSRVRQLRTTRAKKRMMAAVPKATVVIANPTHFAVALRYDKKMPAPVCVAKGVDALALRIRALAEESGVAVVENPPLARTLYAAVEIDAEIPVEHYKAVAEVIGYVLRLRGRAS
ncbi:flagellar biosynthesis protein FlhB [Chelatococcus sp. SYSU_G07232]|uniref:Flagellar biosynthetic protein FlhB n=1 Tax=Chelatococcus albus TaxID=3047466 RepID=A0ABT7AHH1_9HYPH|nr:flagellar biosynthesis protein FlhB [Chelatococcus sp. SYSU_G07232]MDJ1158437.1 flagellar biosynthesis protein FlhB [Chelatococcus sp. SYSU_G07232]